MKKILFILILLSLSLPSTLFAQEAVSCSVEPYSQTLKENGSVTFSYTLSDGGDASRLSLGGLPGGITGEFSTGNKLTVSALQGAQLGSFDVSVLYDVQEGGLLLQAACSFNIVVEPSKERDVTQEYIPLESHSQQLPVIERGQITIVPQIIVDTPAVVDTPVGNSQEGMFVSPLYLGIRSEEVKELQAVLKKAGYFPSWVDVTGYYGEITEKAVSDFQAKHGIEVVGFVGPLTRTALNNLQL